VKVSIIIPVFNERATIGEVLDRVLALPFKKEVIVVDDGSTDGTTEFLSEYQPDVIRVHFNRLNFGKGTAIRIGLTYVTGDIVAIQDADLELVPEELVQLLEAFKDESVDVVYGSRFLCPNPGIPRLTRIANRFLTGLTNLLFGSRLTDMETAYKLFRRKAIQGLELTCRRFEFEPEVTAKLLRAGYAIHEIPISYRPRRAYEGKKIGWGDGITAIETLVRCRLGRSGMPGR